MATEILDVLVDLRDRRQPHALATVVETEGSVSAKTGAKAVIDRDGRVLAGWVGGGCAESATCQAALEAMEGGRTQMVEIDMTDEMLGVGMPCGGSMRVYVEPVMPKPTLWIMGHGRVAECLCQMGDLMGLEVVVNDPQVTARDYPAASRLVTDDMDYAALEPRQDDYVVIATQHKGDHQSTVRALDAGAGYIALIASRKRAGLVMDFLEQRGYTDEQLARVHAPAGIDLGARTPEEIALSVISEIVQLRRGGTGRSMRGLRLADDTPAGTPPEMEEAGSSR
ncbi:XdhC family protein [Ectothiorhodospiraceae bacterium WFHF3C12]|nr:XdhC family protein [Ectothiorhodospiraceae bacterium WFHF3C12]